MNKSSYIYILTAIITVTSIISLVPLNVEADGVYPATIHDVDSQGVYNFANGDVYLDGKDVINLHNELESLGIWADGKIAGYNAQIETQSTAVNTGKQSIATKINSKTGTTTVATSPVPTWTQLSSGIDTVYTKGYNAGKQNSTLKKIGSGAGTYNLSSYPGYENFTVNGNIFVTSYVSGSGHGGHNANGDRAEGTVSLSVTYNSSTGILTVTNGSNEFDNNVTLKLKCICDGVYITAN